MPASMPHRHDRTAPSAARADDLANQRRTGASLLLWVVLLVAVIMTAWYFVGRQDDRPADPVPIGDAAGETSRSPVSAPPASRDTPARERQRAAPALPDRDALPLSQPAPAYPAAAQRAGEQGTVLLQVEVGAGGRPDDVSLARRSGSRDLDRAALEAVRGWTFEPATRNGEPVASTVQVPVEFRLDTI